MTGEMEKDKIYNRTMALFSTRLLVLLDKHKENYVAELLADSIKSAVEILYPAYNIFDRMQKNEQHKTLDKIKTLLIDYLTIKNQ